MSILDVQDIKKTYTTRFGGNQVKALKGVSFTVEEGEYVAIMGESGSGKTTLLNILAALDKATGGKVLLDGKELSGIKDRELAAFRRKNLGFVFQEFNLLDTFSIKDNILLPMVLNGGDIKDMSEKLEKIASALGISELLDKFPYEVSGGQKQRAAAARALITSPKIILADEPTGALDSQSSEDLLKVFEKINNGGQTILMVTHSVNAAAHAKRVLFIRDGVVFHQIYKGDNSEEQFYQKISETLTMLRTGGER
jgi:putative ABC transport system ATP-binding protein